MTPERWSKLMHVLGFDDNTKVFHALCKAYSEKHRHYHTREHIEACLSHLDRCITQASEPREIELAIWFHDSVYRPFSRNNEKKSAEWAVRFLLENSAPSLLIERVRRLIQVTDHATPTQTKDESLLVDIDLAILGATAQTYAAFEAAVRQEYRWIPACIYRKQRIAMLNRFLQRPRIYQNEPFYSEREQQARANLAAAIA